MAQRGYESGGAESSRLEVTAVTARVQRSGYRAESPPTESSCFQVCHLDPIFAEPGMHRMFAGDGARKGRIAGPDRLRELSAGARGLERQLRQGVWGRVTGLALSGVLEVVLDARCADNSPTSARFRETELKRRR
jgi:hypothetical protein